MKRIRMWHPQTAGPALAMALLAISLSSFQSAGSLALAQSSNLPSQPLSEQNAPYSMTPAEVMARMHHMNQLEMKMGELARVKATSPDVRRFGDLLFRDHRAADVRLLDLAERAQIGVREAARTDEEQELLERLQRLTGYDFDQTYLGAMELGHEKAYEMLGTVQQTLTLSPLRDLLGGLLPILKQHLKLAVDLQRRSFAND